MVAETGLKPVSFNPYMYGHFATIRGAYKAVLLNFRARSVIFLEVKSGGFTLQKY